MDGSIHVAAPTLIYALMDNREAFDRIRRPTTDHGENPKNGGHVLSKDMDCDGCTIVFQFWVKQPSLSHQIEERLSAQRASASA